MLSTEAVAEINRLAAQYPEPRSAVIPGLYIAQKEHGYCSAEAIADVADVLHLTPGYVRSVASFYTMYFKEPVGKHSVDVCTNLACTLRGAEPIVNHISEVLHCAPEHTTDDKKFTLHCVECLGYCDIAPMMQIDDQTYGHLTPETVNQILKEYTAHA